MCVCVIENEREKNELFIVTIAFFIFNRVFFYTRGVRRAGQGQGGGRGKKKLGLFDFFFHSAADGSSGGSARSLLEELEAQGL